MPRNPGQRKSENATRTYEKFIKEQYDTTNSQASKFVRQWLPKAKRMSKKAKMPVNAALCILYQQENC